MLANRQDKLERAVAKREQEFLAITAYDTVIQTDAEQVAIQPCESFGSISTNIQHTSD
ncbi:5377_t:CDS:1, partial [Dentiscutata erythropus]